MREDLTMKTLLLLAMVLSASMSYASPGKDPYFEISDVQTQVIESSDDYPSFEHPERNYVQQDPTPSVGDIIATARQIIAFGKEIYKIIEAGKPVINTSYAPISVLPLETKHGTQITPFHLSHWQRPKFVKFKVSYINGYKQEVVAFTYNVNMSHGGQYDGTGSYITNAQIVPEQVSVAWGYTFNASMSLVGVTNIGSEANPIAGATLVLSYSVKTVFKEEKKNMTLFIAGDGTIQQM